MNGTATESVNFFPGGTYNVTADYAGDGTFAPSTSAPLSLTVTPEASAVAPIVNYDTTAVVQGTDTEVAGRVQNGQQIAFGGTWTFQATPTGVTSQTSGLATGTVTFTDGSTSTAVPIGSLGTATIPIPVLAVGSHSVGASYSGDASYQSSTGGPLNFTVVQGSPRLLLAPNFSQFTVNGSVVPIPGGTNLTVGVLVGTGHGVAPTGNVSVTLGNSTQTAALTSADFNGEVFAGGEVTFANLQPGSFALMGSYAGDANWNEAAFTAANPIAVATAALVPTTTTLTVSPTSINSQSSVTLAATVQAGAGATLPIGDVVFYVGGATIGAALLPSTTGGSSGTATLVLPGTSFPSGTNQITAGYSGFPPPGANFGPSTSAPVSVTVTPSDFRMFVSQSQLIVPSGQSGSAAIALDSVGGSNLTVSLSCGPVTGALGCGVTPQAPMVNGSATATLMVNAYTIPQVAPTVASLLMNISRRSPPPGLFIVWTLATLLALYRGPRRRISARAKLALVCCAVAGALLLNACGGGSTPTLPQKINTPPGTYGVLVTATGGGATHNAKLTVVVQ